MKYEMTEAVLSNDEALDQFYFAYLCYHELDRQRGTSKRKDKDFFGFLFILAQQCRPAELKYYATRVDQAIDVLNVQWAEFISTFAMLDVKFTKVFTDKETGERRGAFNANAWYRNHNFENDVKDYFKIYREGPEELVELP